MRLTCSICFELKTSSELRPLIIVEKRKYKHKPVNERIRVCKKCHSFKCANYLLERLAQKNPEKFNDCNDCDRLFSKTEGNKSYKKIRESCPYCGSENFTGVIYDN
jgi:hypothetical protein